MKRIMYLVFSALLLCGIGSISAGGQDRANARAGAAHGQEYNESLRKEIFQLQAAGQEVRQRALASKYLDNNINEEMDRIDSLNTERLRRIMEANGLPGIDAVGVDGLRAVFLLIQQSPSIEFQKEMLPALKASADRGELAMEAYAMLVDRVLLKEGKRQAYGTQAEFVDGKVALAPIEDEEHVDERRHKVGLIPIADYIKALERAHEKAAESQRKATSKN
ncbi:MAG: DUF6624 domain-containing protein [Blastocatellia bacterium]